MRSGHLQEHRDAASGEAPGWRYRELADNHLAPINAPQVTAEVLLSLL